MDRWEVVYIHTTTRVPDDRKTFKSREEKQRGKQWMDKKLERLKSSRKGAERGKEKRGKRDREKER